jgi:hypothetical protein
LRANLHPGEAGIELVTERFGEIGKRCCDHRDIIAKPILTECDGVLDGRISRTELDSLSRSIIKANGYNSHDL